MTVERARAIFDEAPFIRELGIVLVEVTLGDCRSALPIHARHGQQDGRVHAGVVTTLADHTAGAAALSLAPEGQRVLSVEFKVNLLRAAQGPVLTCHATVLKAGRTLTVAEAEVFSQDRLVAKATVTLALVNETSSLRND